MNDKIYPMRLYFVSFGEKHYHLWADRVFIEDNGLCFSINNELISRFNKYDHFYTLDKPDITD